MADPKKSKNGKQSEKHWKMVRHLDGLDVYDDNDGGEGGSGDFSSVGVEDKLSREDIILLQQHETRQANHAKETKNLIIERTYQLNNGNNNFGNADQQQFGNDSLAHPLLADKAQFSGMEEGPLTDTDNNQERQLQLRKEPEAQPAPAPSMHQTPTFTRR